MLNILKKIPIIETIIILLLNFQIFCFEMLVLISLGISVECPQEPRSIGDYKTLLSVLMYFSRVVGFYILVYKDLFDISRNKFFIKLVYYLKYHVVALSVLCVFLLLFSISFLALGSDSIIGFIYGVFFSHAFPIIVIYLCWNILDKVKKHNVKIGKNLYNFIIWILFLVLTAGGVDWLIPRNYYHPWDSFLILPTLIIILVTVITVTTEQTCKVIKRLNKKILIPLMLIWGIVVYESIRIFPKSALTYCLLYLFVLVLCFLILAPLVIKLKRKNKAFRAEVEAEVLQSIAERSNNKKTIPDKTVDDD